MNAGTIITCPGCKKDLYKTRRPISEGDVIYARIFESIDQSIPDPVNGSTASCPFCSTQFFKQCLTGVRIHTKEGWI